jgi:hypothetical protein
MTRRRSRYWWDPEIRKELLGRLRQWLDEAHDADELVVSRRDVETAESALADALRDIPMLEKKLNSLLWQDACAKRAIRDGKGKDRLYEACRIKGWIPQEGNQTKYPPCESLVIEHQYVALTTRSGQVTIGDEAAEFPQTGDVIEELLVTIDDCPLEPWDAVVLLANFYDAASPNSFLQELWKRHKKIETWRRELLQAGDEAAAKALPKLRKLPQNR